MCERMRKWIGGIICLLPCLARADMARISSREVSWVLAAGVWCFCLPWVIFTILYRKAGRSFPAAVLLGFVTPLGLAALTIAFLSISLETGRIMTVLLHGAVFFLLLRKIVNRNTPAIVATIFMTIAYFALVIGIALLFLAVAG